MKRTILSILIITIVYMVQCLVVCAEPASSTFKDPYNNGITLADGGGEPGKAYMAFINAAYKKD